MIVAAKAPYTTPAGRRRSTPGRLLLLTSASGLVALLVVYHALLLWQRIASLTLLEPGVAVRWLATPLLLAALFYLRRRGVSLLWGRRAVVFWLLVLFLHISFSGPVSTGPEARLDLTHGPSLLLALPATVVGLLAAGLQRLGPTAETTATRPEATSCFLDTAVSLALSEGWLPKLACRPPPA